MENQNTSSFPFDAVELPDDFDANDFLADVRASASDADRRDVLAAVRRMLEGLDQQVHALLRTIESGMMIPAATPTPNAVPIGGTGPTGAEALRAPAAFGFREPTPVTPAVEDASGALRVIEGVFDGQHMVGPDGKYYSVPANYASKSKLVEGDILKLTITARGAFVYKQIGPIARDRCLGVLTRDDVTGEFVVLVPEHEEDRSTIIRALCDRTDLPVIPYKRYRTLRASVSYYRGQPGDEVAVFVPKDAPSTWAAVENVIKR